MSVQKVGRRGESLAARLPREVAESAGLDAGQTVEISARGSEIVIRPSRPQALEEMFAGRSADEWRKLYRGVDPWG
jgi:antitoxin component of MazEF toxin-antitoxin module